MMFVENKILDKLLIIGRKIIPKGIFTRAQPIYHWMLGMFGAVIYGFPSRGMKIIAVTGTKGKSTTVYMISKIFEEQGLPVAAVGSLGFKIKDKTWPNILKMTLPGRLKLQKFLWRAKNAGCKYMVLEATSEGIAQNRLAGVKIDCAVYTNLHREHLESHGSFENYMAAKQKLFLKTRNMHVLNIEDPYFEKFTNFPAQKQVTYGREWGDVSFKIPNFPGLASARPRAGQFPISNENLKIENSLKIENQSTQQVECSAEHLSYKYSGLKLKILGDFNLYNALAALAVTRAYGLDMEKAVVALNSIESIPGRMEVIDAEFKGLKFKVVIDYAHTPDSLELVYKTLRQNLKPITYNPKPRLICLLGAAGGGRDKWKRPEFGRIAAEYCDEVILTNEDPYDENPEEILEQISSGFSSSSKFRKILDRREAIRTALTLARAGDTVVITGKGSETSMAVARGRKIPWSDREIVRKLLQK